MRGLILQCQRLRAANHRLKTVFSTVLKNFINSIRDFPSSALFIPEVRLNMTLIYLIFFIGALTLTIGRTTLLQGVIHPLSSLSI
jgi:hypothetical protein